VLKYFALANISDSNYNVRCDGVSEHLIGCYIIFDCFKCTSILWTLFPY